ncbi:MAG: hypothetical protein U9P80_09300, partial [Thermodesulfobacteriota bacterium]|nr:hypothetical protein [Thermodesulfobacteriota bacterium]
GVIVPLLCLGLSMVWVLGGCAMLGIELHPMALLFPLVLGLVSMGYSAMIMAEYYRLFKETGDKNASISGAFSRTSLIAAMVILGLVSAVMCLVPVPMFQGMGYAGIIWMVGGFGFIVLGLPLMISLFPEPKEANGQVEPETGARSGSSHAWILLGFALVIGLGCFSATKLNVGDNVPGYDYISEGHPWAECFSIFSEKFMGPRQLLVYVEADAPGGLLEPEAMNAIGAFSRFLRNEGGATDSIGFDMMVCMTRGMLMDANPKWQTVPVTRDKIFGMSGMVMEEGGAEAFMGPKYTRAVISPFFPKQDTAAINAYASSMQTYIDTHPYEHCRFSLGGGLLGMTKVLNDTTRHVYPVIIAASFLVLLVLGAMVSGSLITGVLVAIPVAAAQALLWIMMLVFQMKIGLPMVGVAPVALGFGAMFGLYACTGGSSVSRGTLAWTGGLVFAASLPWFFIGMRFQGSMMMFFGMMVVFENLCALGFMPVWKSWSDIHSNENNGGIYG